MSGCREIRIVFVRETYPGDPPLDGNTFDEISSTVPEKLNETKYRIFEKNMVYPLYKNEDLREASLRNILIQIESNTMTGRTGVFLRVPLSSVSPRPNLLPSLISRPTIAPGRSFRNMLTRRSSAAT